MFEDRVESVIKEEVGRMVADLMTKEEFEKVVVKAVAEVFEPIARKQELAALEYIPEKDVGVLFPLAPSTLKTWRSRKMPCPPYSKVGDRIIYKISDLHEFFSQHRVNEDD